MNPQQPGQRTPGATPGERTPGTTRSAKPKNVFQSISKLIKKVFKVIQYLIHLLYEVVENLLHLSVFLFGYLVKVLASPTTPVILSILLFAAVTTVAGGQWYSIGLWLGRLLGFKGLFGLNTGLCGLAMGFGLNVYQIAPQLWKIRKDVAKSYIDLKIDTEHISEGGGVKQKISNWLSVDHSFLKKSRLASYALETTLVLSYAFFTGLSLFTIIQAAVSLLLPEKCLELVSSTVGVLGGVSNNINNKEEEPDLKL